MNKDVIYIEPEDDITDIISKIENAKQKIVALVPPKKAGVFRSVVNIKLIAKAATSSNKKVVLVTVDPSIVKLAGATKLPVAKDLNSAPSIPDEKVEVEESEKEELVEEDGDEEVTEEEEVEEESEEESDTEDETEEEESDAEEEKSEAKKSKKNALKEKTKALKDKMPKNKFVDWFLEHKKIAIAGGVSGLVLIALLVWAFVFAPAVTITVGIRTVSNNFSENVSFTSSLAEENIEEGRFYYEEKKIESVSEVEFEATGQKNVGQKAEGNVVVYRRFKEAGSVPIKAGSVFTVNGLSYVTDEDSAIVSAGFESCGDDVTKGEYMRLGCIVSARVPVTAAEPGSKYNIPAKGENAGWDTAVNVAVYSDQPMAGGTDDMKTIVSEADIEKAKGEAAADNEEELKTNLYEKIDTDTLLVIDSSFAISTAEAISTPAIGEEVGEGVKPTLKVVTTATVYVVDKTKIEEFITEKANLGDGMKIYQMNNPFIENFTKTDSGVIGKLKTAYATGPRVTENDVVEITKGKGLGVAQHDLRDIDGVAEVRIDKSYPWVTSVPNNANKITVILEVKE